ncbi:phosphotriesterase-related protein [Bacillus sp. V3-13]|uniref:phosphotriesterase family protein n=1 Tax=Bacillus sp. V3-13 TaxID=2053728 RepID=UPI000C785344|nr:phosphotriesterase-related protein [Bacillus sp. V3-13]PLR75734.1 phosphotriesterase-related protein [Bacillus sp. V3-13]
MALVQTVQGIINSENLGITLMHEHLYIDRSHLWEEPNGPLKYFANQSVSLDILGRLRLNPYANKDNGLMVDEGVAVKEALEFYNFGGQTIVDVTPVALGRDPNALYRLSRRTGLNIIMGCGYYLEDTIPSRVRDWSIEEIENDIISDLEVGVDGTGIKAGIIGEIGISPDMTELEVKVLRAAARAQKKTGHVLTIHLPGWERYGHQILDIVEKEGGAVHKTILDHMNPSMNDVAYQTSLADRGAFLEYDMIGIDLLFPEGQSPSDEDNAKAIINLLEKGYGESLLLSQDVFLKILLKTYGGWGYSHILENFVPRLKRMGVSQQEINTILIDNPRRVFDRES